MQKEQMRRPNDAGKRSFRFSISSVSACSIKCCVLGIIPTDTSGVLPEIEYDSLEFYERLSAGTYGTVYRAKWKVTDQIVAVKRLLVLEKEVT